MSTTSLSETLRQVMRHWATGVAIVTASHQGKRHGMTVNSFTSVSLTPPLVLVCLAQTSQTHDLVLNAGTFGITLLTAEQQALSDRFAGRTEVSDRFAGLETFTLRTGAPLIAGGLAYLDCRVVQTHPAGTHTIVVGEVLAAMPGTDAPPLLYYNRRYRQLAP